MTDPDRAAIDASLQQWVAAQIAKGHPAGLVRERIVKAADDYRRDRGGEQTTMERLRSAVQDAKDGRGVWHCRDVSDPCMPVRPSAGRCKG